MAFHAEWLLHSKGAYAGKDENGWHSLPLVHNGCTCSLYPLQDFAPEPLPAALGLRIADPIRFTPRLVQHCLFEPAGVAHLAFVRLLQSERRAAEEGGKEGVSQSNQSDHIAFSLLRRTI